MTARFAKFAKVNPRTGRFEIDGEPFPYFVALDASIDYGRHAVTELVVRIPLEDGALVDSTWEPDPDTPEAAE